MHNLSGRMHTGVSATSRDGVDRPVGIEVSDGLFQHALHTGALPLPLPATKKRPRVLEADGNPLRRIGFRSRSGVVNRAVIRRVQTNSMMAISALSPRRRTVRVIRVYPPLRSL